MKTEATVPSNALPSPLQLYTATAVAFVVAVLVLVTAVLPVEFGRDPLGAGKALGLLRASTEEEAPPSAVEQGVSSLQPTHLGAVALYNEPYHMDTVELVLEPYDYVEYKYHLAEGAAMLFSWKADGSLTHDFHGEPDGDSKDVRSYDKSKKSAANGSFTAPMTGIHGWFWENPTNKRVTIRLTSVGFYSHAIEFKSDKTRKRHETALAEPQTSPH